MTDTVDLKTHWREGTVSSPQKGSIRSFPGWGKALHLCFLSALCIPGSLPSTHRVQMSITFASVTLIFNTRKYLCATHTSQPPLQLG